MKLAVIGKDVSKSDSPKMHTFIADKMGNTGSMSQYLTSFLSCLISKASKATPRSSGR